MKTMSGGAGIVHDNAKAFDTVPHIAIEHALRRKGVPNPLVELIKSGYEGSITFISHPKGPIEQDLQRGVKQRDPLLFNLVLEPLLE